MPAPQENPAKDAPGRGLAIIVYGLYLGSVMAVVTAPLGALIAHWKRGQAEPWVASHFRFQIRTFWLGILAMAAALALWQLFALLNLSPLSVWAFGYLFFTAFLAWSVGRCAVGIHRLTSNRPIDNPASLTFGLSDR